MWRGELKYTEMTPMLPAVWIRVFLNLQVSLILFSPKTSITRIRGILKITDTWGGCAQANPRPISPKGKPPKVSPRHFHYYWVDQSGKMHRESEFPWPSDLSQHEVQKYTDQVFQPVPTSEITKDYSTPLVQEPARSRTQDGAGR